MWILHVCNLVCLASSPSFSSVYVAVTCALYSVIPARRIARFKPGRGTGWLMGPKNLCRWACNKMETWLRSRESDGCECHTTGLFGEPWDRPCPAVDFFQLMMMMMNNYLLTFYCECVLALTLWVSGRLCYPEHSKTTLFGPQFIVMTVLVPACQVW